MIEIAAFFIGALVFGTGFVIGWTLRGDPKIEPAVTIGKSVEKVAAKVREQFEAKEEPLPRTDVDEYEIEQEKLTGKKPKIDQRLRDPGVYGTGL